MAYRRQVGVTRASCRRKPFNFHSVVVGESSSRIDKLLDDLSEGDVRGFTIRALHPMLWMPMASCTTCARKPLRELGRLFIKLARVSTRVALLRRAIGTVPSSSATPVDE